MKITCGPNCTKRCDACRHWFDTDTKTGWCMHQNKPCPTRLTCKDFECAKRWVEGRGAETIGTCGNYGIAVRRFAPEPKEGK